MHLPRDERNCYAQGSHNAVHMVGHQVHRVCTFIMHKRGVVCRHKTDVNLLTGLRGCAASARRVALFNRTGLRVTHRSLRSFRTRDQGARLRCVHRNTFEWKHTSCWFRELLGQPPRAAGAARKANRNKFYG